MQGQAALNVRILYRNYIPLHTPYASFSIAPPPGIVFEFPKTKSWLKPLYRVYLRFGNFAPVAWMIRVGQRFVFHSGDKSPADKSDVLFYIGMLPEKGGTKPFVVDIEHAYSLLNFSREVGDIKADILERLSNDLCKAIVPLSQAAARTLEAFFESQHPDIAKKIQVIYPALPHYQEVYRGKEDYSIIANDKRFFNIIFVGKDAYGKGLQETLPALHEIMRRHAHVKAFIVSDTPEELVRKYQHDRITFLEPRFTHDEVIRKIFMPAQLFVMPTHSDTFGMVYLDAIACGLPVIATKQFAIPEIVEDGENGLLLTHPPLFLDQPGLPTRRRAKDFLFDEAMHNTIINDLILKIDRVVRDPSLYERLRSNTSKEFRPGGKFAIATRNDQLRDLFRNATHS
jgi:glycosyltransferase involved in cell wall biosynthesis